MELIRKDAILAEPKDPLHLKIKDRDDIEIVGAATSGKADIVVMGDRELHEINGMR